MNNAQILMLIVALYLVAILLCFLYFIVWSKVFEGKTEYVEVEEGLLTKYYFFCKKVYHKIGSLINKVKVWWDNY